MGLGRYLICLRRVRLYFDTLRYLRRVQIFGRIKFRFQWSRVNLRGAPNLRVACAKWQRPASRRASMVRPLCFRFLNEEGDLKDVESWEPASRSKLWIYNLHYFDDLNAADAADRCKWHKVMISKWIVENKPGQGVGWESYPTSLRIVNWIKWALRGNVLSSEARHSLAIQVRYLKGRLEWHLLGNHLFANAKALVFAGCFFHDNEAEKWLECGMNILEKEISEQILPDGGHFERSTMYHSLAYEDMLDIVNLSRSYRKVFHRWRGLINMWMDVANRMGYWLAVMCHPDREISFFNDAAMAVSPCPEALFSYARRLGLSVDQVVDKVVWLKDSGYVRVQQGDAVLFVDVAPLGPDYLPAHGHADTLSYELSVFGQRLVVNSGTSRYGLGGQREYERSTAAHTTLEIDEESSSEVWAGFRVGRRAYPFDVSVRLDGDVVMIEAAHDGYKRLSGQPVHRRRWVFDKHRLEVYDWVDGLFSSAISRVYFSPSVKFKRSQFTGVLTWSDRKVSFQVEGGDVFDQVAAWHPEFGVSLVNTCLAMRLGTGSDALLKFKLEW